MLDSNPTAAPVHVGRIKFHAQSEFMTTLRQRVDDFFRTTGRRRRDCPTMYLKTGIILTATATIYALLVFAPLVWWQVVPLAMLMGFAMALVGFNIQHDGGHHAYSERPWMNRLMAYTIDLVGGSSYWWHWKHYVYHHTYVNIDGHDNDIDLWPYGRLSPHQRRLPWHRWQHFYLWPLYGLLTVKWHFYDDFVKLMVPKEGQHRIPRPRGWDLLAFVGFKLWFFTMAFVVPLCLHPWWGVLGVYLLAAFTAGIVLSVVFQLAHCVEEAEFPEPNPTTGHMTQPWAEHQLETTVDFAQRSRLACWLLGGLNFQIEHHLFPLICHVNYPALAPVVEQTCREFGVPYRVNPTFWSGMASHFRWLRRMGRDDGHVGVPPTAANS
jgi:linoleoyl-CoA desaturase